MALAIGSLILISLGGVVGQALQANEAAREGVDLNRQARFAMDRMEQAVRRAPRLLLPLAENTATVWSESIRDPGVLAVTLDATLDRNRDEIADGDNDGDGRVDEDTGNDMFLNGAPGIIGIDDDGDGFVDEGSAEDDDEDGFLGEDPVNGIDDDGDGAVDEDAPGDANGDLFPGVAGSDDDGDGSTDEGNLTDDDEDGINNEDYLDVVVFYLADTSLIERAPVNWDENRDFTVNGADFLESPIAENVTAFRVERIEKGGGRMSRVEISLTLTPPGGDALTLKSKIRVGGL